MSQTEKKPKSRDKKKLARREPELMPGIDKRLQEILRKAGVTKKNLNNTVDCALINYFIKITFIDGAENERAKRPDQPPPLPPNGVLASSSVIEQPLPPSMSTVTPLSKAVPQQELPETVSEQELPEAVPEKELPEVVPETEQPVGVSEQELPAITTGIESLLNEIQKGFNLRSIKPNQRFSIKRGDSNVIAQALKNALGTIKEAKQYSSSEDEDDSDQSEWFDES